MISFKRYAPGLYVDSTETWVISREQRNWYSIRKFLRLGPTLSGEMFPDYGSIWYGDYSTLAEAKTAVTEMITDGFMPANDSEYDLAIKFG